MGVFREIGRRVEQFKTEAETAAEENSYRCTECDARLDERRDPCPECGAEGAVEVE